MITGMDVESRRQMIALMRFARVGQVVAMAINVYVAWLDIHLHLYASVGISVTMILCLLGMMTLITRVIRIRRAQLRSLEAELRRPDYGQIADMEHAIFGRTFDHGRSDRV